MKTPQQPLGTLVMLDNQDSFTYNLVDELAQLGYTLEVYRNTVPLNTLTERLATLTQQGSVQVVLSPGPGHPREAGILMPLIEHCAGRYPMLGICLGFQALVEHFGGNVGRCAETVHGKAAAISHTEHPVFGSIPSPLTVARYHSLQALEVPEDLEVVAEIRGIPMAVCHRTLPCVGFQFHPESIMTIAGTTLLKATTDYLSAFATKETLHA
ncbi:MAG: aminodeoxychorismate/anthranilate synthase component II [Idiomarina sp.]|nr:aminodeoxychorismate/anthranilate synthase component II [Idiomarina sp.]